MLVKEIMTKEVAYVAPDVSMEAVADLMTKNCFHALPVVEAGKILGIIAEADFFTKNSVCIYLPSYIDLIEKINSSEDLPSEKKEKIHALVNATAKDIMTPNCLTVAENMDIAELLEIFKKTNYNTIPVVDESNIIVGIVTLTDIIKYVKTAQNA